jgi:uncharacterized protein YcfL
MKRLLFVLMTVFTLLSCESSERNSMLREQRHEIEKQIVKLRNMCDAKERLLDSLDVELQERHIVLEGRSPQYNIRYRVHFSNLDSALRSGLRDVQNTEFEIPVSRYYYKSINIGKEIIDEGGGFFSGRANMTVEVVNKYMR